VGWEEALVLMVQKLLNLTIEALVEEAVVWLVAVYLRLLKIVVEVQVQTNHQIMRKMACWLNFAEC
jgi:hypothetical protein